jgi:chromosome segregation ATPase
LEEKVEFLMRRNEEAQHAINRLNAEVESIKRQTDERFDEVHAGMTEHVSAVLAAVHGQYLPLRIVGTVAIALGLGLATWGNFLS